MLESVEFDKRMLLIMSVDTLTVSSNVIVMIPVSRSKVNDVTLGLTLSPVNVDTCLAEREVTGSNLLLFMSYIPSDEIVIYVVSADTAS